jgi:hypothetical protein
MPPLRHAAPVPVVAAVSWALLAGVSCKAKATPSQCDELIDRYATLVVREKYPDAGPDQIDAERARERSEARGDDAFKNCSSEVSRAELECALRSPTSDAFLKCLE